MIDSENFTIEDWIEALESGDYTWNHGSLYNPEHNTETTKSMCCLGVWLDKVGAEWVNGFCEDIGSNLSINENKLDTDYWFHFFMEQVKVRDRAEPRKQYYTNRTNMLAEMNDDSVEGFAPVIKYLRSL